MRLYIQEKNELIKFNLPSDIDGSSLFSYKADGSYNETSINVDAINNKWYLKSNGSIGVFVNNSVSEKVDLDNYSCIPFYKFGDNVYCCLFSLPSVEPDQTSYDVGNLESITIGSGNNNNIIYQQNMMAENHAIIKKQNNSWIISPASNNPNIYIYVNNRRVVGPMLITAGDIIFMNGLRIVWMNKFITIPMGLSYYTINGLSKSTEVHESNKNYSPVSEADSNVLLFKNDDCFSHTPRIREIIEPKVISIDAPPGRLDSNEELPFIITLGSSLSMFTMSLITTVPVLVKLANGEVDFKECIPVLAMSAVTFITSLVIPIISKNITSKSQKRKERNRQKKYSKYLQEKEQEISVTIKNQESILRENFVDIDNCVQMLANRNRNFWNRELKDNDFAEVRIGLGDRPSYLEVEAPAEQFSLDDDNLLQNVYSLRRKYKMLRDVPVTVNFKESIVMGFLISSGRYDFINGVILQLLTFHSPLELKLVIITDESKASNWDYLRYVPHCWSDDRQVRFFAENTDDVKILASNLENIFSKRIAEKTAKEKLAAETGKEQKSDYQLYDSYYLVITDNFELVKPFKFTEKLLENQFNYGFSMVVIDDSMRRLPKECKKFVSISGEEGGIFSGQLKTENIIKFRTDYCNKYDMNSIGKLVSNVPIQGKDAESQLPNSLSFLNMYNVGKIEQLNIVNRWASSDPVSTLRAPVGVHKNGELFYLDLHEKKDGPHGLIAGSTGSGKSEFIITYILSMCLNYDPREVQFVLIDYKGGGLAGAFENRDLGISIPHLAGTITNLDVSEMNRTLVSIDSEIKRRQRKFNEVREQTGESTMDIYKYQRLYREGIIKEPISHLFIISDEFAELKSQQPEFMAQLISIARIGRSLGVHLILATQKPSGVVNDQIWSNSRFKVCLKVQTVADSNEMLKRPEAASIKETGRFYLQVGYDEYFDIGQSAWSGDKYVPVERIVKKLDDSIIVVDNCGEVIKQKANITSEVVNNVKLGDQLTNIVKALQEIATKKNIKPTYLWLPSLRSHIDFSTLLKKYKYNDNPNTMTVVCGEYDAPEIQKQGLLTYDLFNSGNVLIYGTPGAGKENLVMNMLYSLFLTKSPEELNVYIGDFGAETLPILKAFPQVGDTFVTDDANKLDSLLKFLNKIFIERKKNYSNYGGSFIEYNKDPNNKKDVSILVVLNNFENFNETYARTNDSFNLLFRDGAKYGIYFIVTSATTDAIKGKVMQSFENRICLHLSDDFDYRYLLGSPKGLVPSEMYGRGIALTEFNQTYVFQSAETCEISNRISFVKEESKKILSKYPNLKAKKIPVLPDTVYVDDVMFELKGLDCVPVGIEKNSLEVYVYNFVEKKINLIAAKTMKNHIYFIYALIREMLEIKNANITINIIDCLGIYKGNYKNVKVYNDNFEDAFVNMYNNVKNDKQLKTTNVYFCLGISQFRKTLAKKYDEYFATMFKNVQNCNNNIFLFFDDSSEYKTIQVENWFKSNINNTFGIWLGEDIGVQISLGVMSLSVSDKRLSFPYIGFPIYQGQHMIMKYVVDGVDRNDEE